MRKKSIHLVSDAGSFILVLGLAKVAAASSQEGTTTDPGCGKTGEIPAHSLSPHSPV